MGGARADRGSIRPRMARDTAIAGAFAFAAEVISVWLRSKDKRGVRKGFGSEKNGAGEE